MFGGWAKFGQRAINSRLRKNSASYLFWLVQTCTNLSEPFRNIVTMYARRAVIFSLSNALILQSYFLSWWNCIFNSPNGELSNDVRVMALYWSKIVDPSRSPCLKTVHRKSFERSNFLALRPVLLKIAYFNSANWQLSIDVLNVKLG